MGNVAPEKVKPLPATVAELMVTGALPVEVKVTACVPDAPTFTLPKARLELLTFNVGTDAPS